MKNKHKHAVNLEHKSSTENNELNASMVPKLQISWKGTWVCEYASLSPQCSTKK